MIHSSRRSFSTIELKDKDFKAVCEMVHEMVGINLNENKRELVQARLGKRIRTLGMRSLGEYLTHVREEKSQMELINMLDALSTNLTSFWRESQHFDFVVSDVLPKISARAKKTNSWKIRAWSAGCSTGEEPYGLAMLMAENLESANRYDIQILATDLSTKVLDIAKNGIYSATRVKEVPPPIRNRFFDSISGSGEKNFRVKDEIRSMVKFARLNLMEAWPMKGPFDFIFCRNVMIYFDKPTQAKLVKRYYELLKPSGILFVGHSESLAGIEHKFRYLRPTIYERV